MLLQNVFVSDNEKVFFMTMFIFATDAQCHDIYSRDINRIQREAIVIDRR